MTKPLFMYTGILEVQDNKKRVRDFVKCTQWTTAFTHFWRRPENINVLEANAAVLALHWAVSKGPIGGATIFINDSEIVKGAFAKGRF